MSATHAILGHRALLIQTIRTFFIKQGYLEVDTPVRQPSLIPEEHIEPQQAGEWFLQASPELCMKRLLSSGLQQIFQICKCFRRGERGRNHLPELTLLEWYRRGWNYCDLMEECEELLTIVSAPFTMQNTIQFCGQKVPLQRPWQRLTIQEAFNRFAPISLASAMDSGHFEEILVEHVEPHLGIDRPTFLYNYPASLGSLARLNRHDPSIAERFELYIAGLELANGFSELVCEKEQRYRFQLARKLIQESGRHPGPLPSRFLNDLKKMPEAAGIALGIDRLVMLLTDCDSIDQVVAFTPEEL